MPKIRGGRDFAQESLGAQRGREFRPEHLDCHLALVLQVLGEIDGGHPAGAQLAHDLVLP